MIDVKTDDIETPEMVADRIQKALKVLPPERIFILPDCGLFHLPRDVAFAKLKAMVEGTRIVRKELGKIAWRRRIHFEKRSPPAVSATWWKWWRAPRCRRRSCGRSPSGLAQIPEVVAAGITSYAGGSAGHDPIRVAAGARAQGLTPNVHLTCVKHDPAEIAKALDDLIALGIENVFAITGDYPKGAPLGTVGFACDSVQLVETIAELREQGRWPFYDFRGGVAVQVHGSRLRLSISQAGEEDRRRRRFRHHPARF